MAWREVLHWVTFFVRLGAIGTGAYAAWVFYKNHKGGRKV